MMLSARRVKTYSVKEFLAGEYKRENVRKQAKTPTKTTPRMSFLPLATGMGAATAAAMINASPNVTEAATLTVATASQASMYDRLLNAFDPVIDLIQALSYPVALIVVLGGALFIMIGNKEKGFTLMQNAGLGYVLVQMTPLMLQILADVMRAAL